MSCKAIGEVVVYFAAFKNRKNTLTHLFLVQFGPFQRGNLVFYIDYWPWERERRMVVPPHKENGRRTASEKDVQIFSMPLMLVAVGKAVVDVMVK